MQVAVVNADTAIALAFVDHATLLGAPVLPFTPRPLHCPPHCMLLAACMLRSALLGARLPIRPRAPAPVQRTHVHRRRAPNPPLAPPRPALPSQQTSR